MIEGSGLAPSHEGPSWSFARCEPFVRVGIEIRAKEIKRNHSSVNLSIIVVFRKKKNPWFLLPGFYFLQHVLLTPLLHPQQLRPCTLCQRRRPIPCLLPLPPPLPPPTSSPLFNSRRHHHSDNRRPPPPLSTSSPLFNSRRHYHHLLNSLILSSFWFKIHLSIFSYRGRSPSRREGEDVQSQESLGF